MNVGHPWTPAEEATLLALRAEGLNNAQIGERLNRSRNAIDKKMTHMNKAQQGPRARRVDKLWKDDEAERALKLRATGMSFTEIGACLGRGRHSVKRFLSRQNVEPTATWPQERLDRLKALYTAGQSYETIATAMDTTRGAVGGIIHRMKWTRPTSPQAHAAACRAGRKDRPKRERKPKSPSNVLKFGAVRMSPVVKPPMAVGIEPTPETAVTLVQRTNRQCCYPVGEATGAEQLFCGGQRASGDYCAWHRGVMYQRRSA